LLNVTRCGFIFPKSKTDEELGDLEMYELNIQTGDAMAPSDREYTQWTVEFTSKPNDGLAKRIMRYVQGNSETTNSEEYNV
jgi:LPS O-antigen subunit length determinant protein (WzzB/FepE family)